MHPLKSLAQALVVGSSLAVCSLVTHAQSVKLDHVPKADLSTFWFAYVHFDPFTERYVLDGMAPTRQPQAEDRELAGSEILAISGDGARVQPVYTGRFDYRYKRALGEVLDDATSRVATEYPCNLSDSTMESYQRRHPCGSRFTKPARLEYWPTLGGMMARRPADLSAFSVAAPNPKELHKALQDTGLINRLADVPTKLELMPSTVGAATVAEPVVVESYRTAFALEQVRFLVGGVPAPEGAKLILRGEANLWGRTTIALADVRHMRVVEERAGQCAMVHVRLKSGETKQFSRCSGSPLSVEVDGKTLELEQLQGLARPVQDGKLLKGAKAEPKVFWLTVSALPMRTSLPRLTSLGALTAQESNRLQSPP